MRLFLGPSLLLVGCIRFGAVKELQVNESQRAYLRSQSSGLTGCAPAEITVDEVGGQWSSHIDWRATCRGTVYRCSAVQDSSTNCTRSLTPPGVEGPATPSAAPAPAPEGR
jgi:hypothetical protein